MLMLEKERTVMVEEAIGRTAIIYSGSCQHDRSVSRAIAFPELVSVNPVIAPKEKRSIDIG